MNASSPEIDVLAGELVEHLHAPLERLAEALLLGLDDPLDLGRVLDAARGTRRPTCSITIAGQPVDVVEADPAALLRRRAG